MKWTMVNINNTSMYANSDGVVHVATTAMKYDENSDLIIRWRNNGNTTWEIDRHYIDRERIHRRGIGEDNRVEDDENYISDLNRG